MKEAYFKRWQVENSWAHCWIAHYEGSGEVVLYCSSLAWIAAVIHIYDHIRLFCLFSYLYRHSIF